MGTMVLIAVCGLIAGLASGILGIGGGILLIPIFLYIFKLTIHQAIGTSLAVIVPTALVAALIHAHSGAVVFKVAVIIVGFTIIGSLIGSYVVTMLPAAALKKIFAVFLAIVAIKLFLS